MAAHAPFGLRDPPGFFRLNRADALLPLLVTGRMHCLDHPIGVGGCYALGDHQMGNLHAAVFLSSMWLVY